MRYVISFRLTPSFFFTHNLIISTGADTERNDGIYSRFFTQFTESGRYSLVLSVSDQTGVAKLSADLGLALTYAARISFLFIDAGEKIFVRPAVFTSILKYLMQKKYL